jgi:site-specific DNA-adenine methylase
MKVCDNCRKKKYDKEFDKDEYGELLDICKACAKIEEEYGFDSMDEEEREGWEDVIEKWNKD